MHQWLGDSDDEFQWLNQIVSLKLSGFILKKINFNHVSRKKEYIVGKWFHFAKTKGAPP